MNKKLFLLTALFSSVMLINEGKCSNPLKRDHTETGDISETSAQKRIELQDNTINTISDDNTPELDIALPSLHYIDSFITNDNLSNKNFFDDYDLPINNTNLFSQDFCDDGDIDSPLNTTNDSYTFYRSNSFNLRPIDDYDLPFNNTISSPKIFETM